MCGTNNLKCGEIEEMERTLRKMPIAVANSKRPLLFTI